LSRATLQGVPAPGSIWADKPALTHVSAAWLPAETQNVQKANFYQVHLFGTTADLLGVRSWLEELAEIVVKHHLHELPV
jgi:hypothetical protein